MREISSDSVCSFRIEVTEIQGCVCCSAAHQYFLVSQPLGHCVCVGVCVCLLQTTQILKWRHDAWVSRTISLFVGDAVLIEDSSHGMMHQTGKSFSEYLSHTDHWAGTHEWWYKDITIYLHTHTHSHARTYVLHLYKTQHLCNTYTRTAKQQSLQVWFLHS